jgi:hypothetical protein
MGRKHELEAASPVGKGGAFWRGEVCKRVRNILEKWGV